MNADRDLRCAHVRALASALLDGRLDAARRAAVQRHLHGCATCLATARQLARLSRATHNLPPHRAPPGLGARVHTAIAARRAERAANLADDTARRERTALRGLAAVAFAALGLAIGYRLGSAQPNPAQLAPRADTAFAPTCRRVLADLAWTPRLPASARGPLLRAQLDLFDLRERAAHVLLLAPARSAERELAQLVVDLAESLDAGRDADVGGSGAGKPDRAPSPNATLAGSTAAPAAVVDRVVARHAQQLSPAERRDLTEFLTLKQHLVLSDGTVDADCVQVWAHHGDGGATGFHLATGFASAQALAEAGQAAAATQLEQLLAAMRRSLADLSEPAERLPTEHLPTGH